MAQRPERLTTLLRSVSRAIAASEDARLLNGQALVRCSSGIKVWSASGIERQQQTIEREDVDNARGEAPPTAPPRDTNATMSDKRSDSYETAAESPSVGADEALESMAQPGEPPGPIAEPLRGSVDTAPFVFQERAASMPSPAPPAGAFAESIPPTLAQEPARAVARTGPASALTHKILASVEMPLAKEIGPVARVLVAKYAKQSDDLASLEAHLEAHIPSVEARFRFKKALLVLSEGLHHGSGDTTQAGLRTLQQRQDAAPHVSAVSSQRGVPTPRQIQAAGAKLAAYLGPIAHVIAKREAESVVDLDTLLQRLTEAIRNDADRNGFRAACRDIGRM